MEQRFLVKNNDWTLDSLNHWIVKQWFIKWNDTIQDSIVIEERWTDRYKTKKQRTGVHIVTKDEKTVTTQIDISLINCLFESSVCFTKTRYALYDGTFVDCFHNKSETELLISTDPTFTRPWIGQEVTDHSFFKNDYLISLR